MDTRNATPVWVRHGLLLLAAIVVAAVVRVAVVQVVHVPSGSMVPTLLPGDRVAILNVPLAGDPAPGQVWVVDPAGSVPLIKRVVAVAGDVVAVDQLGAVTVNGTALEEPWAVYGLGVPAVGETVVPDGTVWLLGDNRAASADSRGELGPVPIDDAVGRALLRVWPPGRAGRP